MNWLYKKLKEQIRIISLIISVITLLILVLGFYVPELYFIVDGFIIVLAFGVFVSIFWSLVIETYDFNKRKLKTANPISIITGIVLLVAMSIPGGIVGWICFLSAVLFFIIQSFLWLNFLVRKTFKQKKS